MTLSDIQSYLPIAGLFQMQFYTVV